MWKSSVLLIWNNETTAREEIKHKILFFSLIWSIVCKNQKAEHSKQKREHCWISLTQLMVFYFSLFHKFPFGDKFSGDFLLSIPAPDVILNGFQRYVVDAQPEDKQTKNEAQMSFEFFGNLFPKFMIKRAKQNKSPILYCPISIKKTAKYPPDTV